MGWSDSSVVDFEFEVGFDGGCAGADCDVDGVELAAGCDLRARD